MYQGYLAAFLAAEAGISFISLCARDAERRMDACQSKKHLTNSTVICITDVMHPVNKAVNDFSLGKGTGAGMEPVLSASFSASSSWLK